MADRGSADDDAKRLHLLVLRCQAGDEGAFVALMESFGPRTLAYLHGLVGDDAPDVQQEVWLAVYRRVAGLANPGAFRTWLFTTTRHRAIDWLRARRREEELLADPRLALDEAIDVADDALSLDGIALTPALAALPPPQREVLLLRYAHGMSYGEIAVVVGCPVGTIRSRLHHAKQRLQELLDGGRS